MIDAKPYAALGSIDDSASDLRVAIGQIDNISDAEFGTLCYMLDRLAATARAGLADTERMERLSDPEFWDRISFDDDRQQWSIYHGHSIQTPEGLAAHITHNDDLRAAVDSVTKRSGREARSE